MSAINNKDVTGSSEAPVKQDPEGVTISGYEVDTCYGPSATPTVDPGDPGQVDPRIATPGTFPFTRGIHEQMYRKRLWTMRQFAGCVPVFSNVTVF